MLAFPRHLHSLHNVSRAPFTSKRVQDVTPLDQLRVVDNSASPSVRFREMYHAQRAEIRRRHCPHDAQANGVSLSLRQFPAPRDNI
jgi:hypothetical protein